MTQPSKGVRIAIITRAAPELRDAVLAGAREHGMGMSDYVATLLAQALDLPQLTPAARARHGRGVPASGPQGARPILDPPTGSVP